MRYLQTKTEHYKKFIRENKSDRLCKGLKILPENSKSNLLKLIFDYNVSINEEIFETPIETKYTTTKGDKHIKINFHTNSDTEYRIDIYQIEESIGLVNHISFTEDSDRFDKIPENEVEYRSLESDYHKPTNRHEMTELLRRMNFILRDLVKNGISNLFCIGGTEIFQKNNIYEYFLKVVVGEDGFKKLNTDVYPDSGWGLYFKIP